MNEADRLINKVKWTPGRNFPLYVLLVSHSPRIGIYYVGK